MIDITAELITAFRAAYPYFSSTTDWTDDVVTVALNEGDAETGSSRWGIYEELPQNFKRRGLLLYAAHYLIATYPRGITGTMRISPMYVVSNKSVGDESQGFATGTIKNTGDSWLNSTVFGQQWLRLRRRAGMGAVAV